MGEKTKAEKAKADACRIAIEAAAELVNRVCGETGARAVTIRGKNYSLTFSVPPEVAGKVGNPMTLEEATETLMRLPWSREWSAGIAEMVYGPEWEALPPEKREEIQRRLIREKLAPEIVKGKKKE